MRYRVWILLGVVFLPACEGLIDLTTSCGVAPQPFIAGAGVSGAIETTDCKSGGDYFDAYTLVVTEQSGFVFNLTGTINGGMSIFAGQNLTAFDDKDEILSVDRGQSAKGFFPPGAYTLVVGSNGTGNYTLQTTGANSNGCSSNYTMRGASFGAAITDLDCAANAGAKVDIYAIQLKTGQPLTVTISILKHGGIEFRSRTRSGTIASRQFDAPGGGDWSFSYTPTSTDWFEIAVFGEPARFGATGYSLTLN